MKKLLVIDDKPENLRTAEKAIEEIRKEGELEDYTVEYCDDFDEALKKVEKKKYNEVITDLFKGRIMPKGLLVTLKCLDRGIKVGILTDGNRHHNELGAVRYYLQDEKERANDCSSDVVRELKKLGIALKEIEKRNMVFYTDLLIRKNGVEDKNDVRTWRESIKIFLGIPYLAEYETETEIRKKIKEIYEEYQDAYYSGKGECGIYIYDVEGGDYFKIANFEGKNWATKQHEQRLYLVEKQKDNKINVKEVLALKTKSDTFYSLHIKEAKKEKDTIIVKYKHKDVIKEIKARVEKR